MMRIRFAETPTHWMGIALGYFDTDLENNPAAWKLKRHALQEMWAKSHKAGTSFKSELTAATTAAKTESPEIRPLVTYTMPREPQKPSGGTDKLGIEAASARITKAVLGSEIKANTFQQFQAEFIRRVQNYILHTTEQYGCRIIADTHAQEIYSLAFLAELGRRIEANNIKSMDTWALKMFLLTHWESLELHKLTKAELASKTNTLLSSHYSPEAIYKTAQRLGLLSSLEPGRPVAGLFTYIPSAPLPVIAPQREMSAADELDARIERYLQENIRKLQG
jgi:hypothetical protein